MSAFFPSPKAALPSPANGSQENRPPPGGGYNANRSNIEPLNANANAKPVAVAVEVCQHCQLPMGRSQKFCGSFYALKDGSKVHSECYQAHKQSKAPKCEECNAPVTTIRGRFSGRYYTAHSGGQIHEECWVQHQLRTCERCLHCSKGICNSPERGHSGRYVALETGRKVHAECIEEHRQQTAPKCAQCNVPIMPQMPKFAGSYCLVPPKGGGSSMVKVHTECMDQWRITVGKPCAVCGEAIAPVPGRFEGSWFDTADGPIHTECSTTHEVHSAVRCSQCSLAITKSDRFSGSMVEVEGLKMHSECLTDYHSKTAAKCAHCALPVVAMPGKSGKFFTTKKGADKVHAECWEEYVMAVLEAECGG